MLFSNALLVVFKTTGGKAWNKPGGLKPLTSTQKRNRRKNIEQTLKNISVLKMAAAHEPAVPIRLFKPLNHWRATWMRRKLEDTKLALGWKDSPIKAALPALGAALPRASAPSLLPPAAQAALRQ